MISDVNIAQSTGRHVCTFHQLAAYTSSLNQHVVYKPIVSSSESCLETVKQG